jgi:hypothetical protein
VYSNELERGRQAGPTLLALSQAGLCEAHGGQHPSAISDESFMHQYQTSLLWKWGGVQYHMAVVMLMAYMAAVLAGHLC